MIEISDTGLILRYRRLGEADAWGVMLTEAHGLKRFFARSAFRSKKRFGGSLDLFHKVAFVGSARDASQPLQLREAQLLNGHLGLRSVFESFQLACTLAEVATRSLEESSSVVGSREFELLQGVFESLHHVTAIASTPGTMDAANGATTLALAPGRQASTLQEQSCALGVVFLLRWFDSQGWLPDGADCEKYFHLSRDGALAWAACLGSERWRHLDQGDEGALSPTLHDILLQNSGRWFDLLLRWGSEHHSLHLTSMDDARPT